VFSESVSWSAIGIGFGEVSESGFVFALLAKQDPMPSPVLAKLVPWKHPVDTSVTPLRDLLDQGYIARVDVPMMDIL